jgi:hypothetical protein
MSVFAHSLFDSCVDALLDLSFELKTKSLQDKIQALCASGKPQRGHMPVDLDNVKEFNATRNAIVHPDMLGRHIPETLKLLQQAGTTGAQLIDLVGSLPSSRVTST